MKKRHCHLLFCLFSYTFLLILTCFLFSLGYNTASDLYMNWAGMVTTPKTNDVILNLAGTNIQNMVQMDITRSKLIVFYFLNSFQKQH